MKLLLSIAAGACVLGFASLPAQAKGICNIQQKHDQAQCNECSNMKWEITRAAPKGECVSSAPAPNLNPAGSRLPPAPVPAPPKVVCDIHRLQWTEPECDRCSNMTWSRSSVFPQGKCVSTAAPQTLTLKPGTLPPPPTPANAPNCTPTHWGGATLPLAAPNFSGTGAHVGVCSKGFNFAKSQFKCSNGTPVPAFNAPTTNVSCNHTIGAGANPQVTINGTPCCL